MRKKGNRAIPIRSLLSQLSPILKEDKGGGEGGRPYMHPAEKGRKEGDSVDLMTSFNARYGEGEGKKRRGGEQYLERKARGEKRGGGGKSYICHQACLLISDFLLSKRGKKEKREKGGGEALMTCSTSPFPL